ncbi:HK97 family phage prohead protease [Roseobacter sp. TSBP12]|uniref:HK97 family phage prohead protease n=1 Tax=Roseobacter sp. TSBP12 TaxID=1236613 RepID=UPI00125F5774|nr:HK97 family phage prohead protease [Roseobacter sp. TSBP12]KAB6714322.1 HK97 family phage prohead protease [Roseobacter sp. TSBP12]
MEHKHLSLDIKASGEGLIEGYGAIFDAIDQGGDIIAPGAFAASLVSGRRVKMLKQHDPDQVIGVWDEVAEDGRGLRVKGHMLLTTDRGREAFEEVKATAVDGLSIGYRTVDAGRTGKARLIKKAELWEVSLVTFPMQELARVDGFKAADAFEEFKTGNSALLKRWMEESLREAGFTNTEAKAASAAAANKIGAMREAGTGLDDLAQMMRQKLNITKE